MILHRPKYNPEATHIALTPIAFANDTLIMPGQVIPTIRHKLMRRWYKNNMAGPKGTEYSAEMIKLNKSKADNTQKMIEKLSPSSKFRRIQQEEAIKKLAEANKPFVEKVVKEQKAKKQVKKKAAPKKSGGNK